MKTLKQFFIATATLLFISSCGDKSLADKKNSNRFYPSYEIILGDTCNKTDIKGLKQGHWIIFQNPHSDSTQPHHGTFELLPKEEGFYKDNKKQGLWKYRNGNNVLKDSIEYKDDVPVK